MRNFTLLACSIPIFNGKILILQRSFKSKLFPGNWGLPAGKVNANEDVETAALRELKEETGLTGNIVHYVGTSKFLSKVGLKSQCTNIQINYLVSLHSDEVILDSSSEDYEWININDFENSKLDNFNKKTLRQFFRCSVYI